MRASLLPFTTLCLGILLGNAGCAAVWGFDDLSQARDAGAHDSAVRDAGVRDGATSDSATCQPDDAADCAGKCGSLLNRCGKVIACSGCAKGQTCGGGGTPNVCGTGTCTPSCDGKACGASNGCNGICTDGTCAQGQHCVSGACTCDTTSCNGCCSGNTCQPGNTAAACGQGGTACITCSSGSKCSSQHCTGGIVTLFGGSDDLRDFGDTWQFDGTKWTEPGASGPTARSFAVGASLNNEFVLFGGINVVQTVGSKELSDTWQFDGTTWTQVNSPGPGPRYNAAAGTVKGRFVLFGGLHVDQTLGSQGYGDTWEFDGTGWTKVGSSGPSPRWGAAAAVLGGNLVLLGGSDANGDLGDTWQFDGATWTRISASGPGPRWGAAAAVLGDKLLLFGGGHNSQVFGDTWQFDGTTWTQVSSSGPTARFGAVAAALNGEIVLFGGWDDNLNAFGDTWLWDGTQWTQVDVAGPAPRGDAVMVEQ